MEKYTKFDDPSCGLNPFTPLETKDDRHWVLKILRKLLSVFLIVLRTPIFFICMLVGTWINTMKYCLIATSLIRLVEKMINSLLGQLMMSSSSYTNFDQVYHREHKEYDFVKLQKGEVKFKMEEGEVYVCNQTCYIDWVYLWYMFSPTFT